VLIVELDGLEAGLAERASQVARIASEAGAVDVKLARDENERALLWKARKRAFGAVGRLAPNYATQDGVVPRTRLPDIMRVITMPSRHFNLAIGNVFHAGDGNIHPVILYDERDPDQVRRAIEVGREILKACVEMGGSLTGEHGIGVEKQAEMPLLFAPEDLIVMSELRRVFDPAGRANPGKVIPTPGGCVEVAAPRRQAPLSPVNDAQSDKVENALRRLLDANRVRRPQDHEAGVAAIVAEPRDADEIAEIVRYCEAEKIALAPLGAARTLGQIRRAPTSLAVSLPPLPPLASYEP